MIEFAAKIRKTMNIFGHKYIYIILLLGVVFMLFANGDKKEKAEEPVLQMELNEEKELESIIEKINGAGDVDVMITYYSGVEKALAYEIQEDKSEQDTNTANSINKKAVMADGEPVIIKNLYPKVKGVVVVSEGAGDIRVKKEIQDAVKTALDVAVHKVCVLEKRSRRK